MMHQRNVAILSLWSCVIYSTYGPRTTTLYNSSLVQLKDCAGCVQLSFSLAAWKKKLYLMWRWLHLRNISGWRRGRARLLASDRAEVKSSRAQRGLFTVLCEEWRGKERRKEGERWQRVKWGGAGWLHLKCFLRLMVCICAVCVMCSTTGLSEAEAAWGMEDSWWPSSAYRGHIYVTHIVIELCICSSVCVCVCVCVRVRKGGESLSLCGKAATRYLHLKKEWVTRENGYMSSPLFSYVCILYVCALL